MRGGVTFFHDVAYENLPAVYSKAGFGPQLMTSRDSRLGVKFVEYLSAGIIPIVNENVIGAAQFCRDYQVGVVIDNNMDCIDEKFCSKLLEKKGYGFSKYNQLKQLLDTTESTNVLEKVFECTE